MDDPIRNIYKSDVDFATLALQDKEFAKCLKTNGQLDFTDPDAVRQLTKSLLKRDFKLDIELPDDRLCPPVPNRLNYILWIQDLMDCTRTDGSFTRNDPARKVVGLDIGTGASCIYPLLACSTRPAWKMAATELDEANVRYAQWNVEKNSLRERISVVPVEKPDDPLIPLEKLPFDSIDFTMCNPPFYESQEELISSAEAKSRRPFSACTGSAIEMVTPGGEVAFVSRMIKESEKLREKVQWYTSMLGMLSSVETLIEKLKNAGITNYAVTEFVQGSKTRRWAIAWSWMDYRPTTQVARSLKSIPKHLLPFMPEFTFHQTSGATSKTIEAIQSEITSLGVPWRWDINRAFGVGYTSENVWSRHARRKQQQQRQRQRQRESHAAAPLQLAYSEATLGFSIGVRMLAAANTEVAVRWVKGDDQAMFESFCGALKRRVYAIIAKG